MNCVYLEIGLKFNVSILENCTVNYVVARTSTKPLRSLSDNAGMTRHRNLMNKRKYFKLYYVLENSRFKFIR